MHKTGGRKSILGGACITMDMYHRRSRRRSSPVRPVINSIKTVINIAPASRAAATDFPIPMSTGDISVAPGQTTTSDSGVPIGSHIKFIEIQYAITNLVAISMFVNMCIQLTRAGQSPVSPLTVGTSMQRNQVHYQQLFSVGKEQNSNHVWRFKVPRRFQRVREGDVWNFSRNASATFTEATQIIYKYYR